MFVDASVEVDELRHEPVEAANPGTAVMTHHGDPAGLLALVDTVGAAPGAASTISIPAIDLDLGFELSEATAEAVAEAIELIVELATS